MKVEAYTYSGDVPISDQPPRKKTEHRPESVALLTFNAQSIQNVSQADVIMAGSCTIVVV